MEQPFDYFVDTVPCVRCRKRGYVEICEDCMNEMDRFALEALKVIATEAEIDEWAWQHNIRKGEET